LLITRSALSGRISFLLGSALLGSIGSGLEEAIGGGIVLFSAQNLTLAITKRLFRTEKIKIKETRKIKRNLVFTVYVN